MNIKLNSQALLFINKLPSEKKKEVCVCVCVCVGVLLKFLFMQFT